MSIEFGNEVTMPRAVSMGMGWAGRSTIQIDLREKRNQRQ